MMIRVIDPAVEDAEDVLNWIERDPDSFTEGRRNNDMVNWFVAKRLNDLRKGVGYTFTAEMITAYETSFANLMSQLTKRQTDSLVLWDDDWPRKIRVLCEHYAHLNDWQLHGLWLPMEYSDGLSRGQGMIPGL